MYAHCSGTSGSPYSAIQEAPASSLREAPHVAQRHLRDHGAEQIRPHGERPAHEQAALRSALDAEMPGRRDLARDQVLGHRDEVLERLDAVLLQRRLVPARAELAAAADVGERVHAAALQPGRAARPRVARRLRDLEAAVAAEQGRARAVGLEALRRDHEVRDLRAVLRRRLVLQDRVMPSRRRRTRASS